MSFSLEGKTALVTGGSRGLGQAIGERLAADDAAVVINYARNEQRAQEVVSAILAKGGKAVAIQADVSKPVEVRRLFSEAEKTVGRLDIVVANAGVYLSKPLIENTEADYDYVFDINTRSSSRCRRPPVACAMGGESSPFPPEARKCRSQTLRFISAAKRRWNNSFVRSHANSARATSR